MVRGKLIGWFTVGANLWADGLTTLKSYTGPDRGDINRGRKKHYHPNITQEQSEG